MKEKLKEHMNYLREQRNEIQRTIVFLETKMQIFHDEIIDLNKIIDDEEKTHIVNNIPHSPC